MPTRTARGPQRSWLWACAAVATVWLGGLATANATAPPPNADPTTVAKTTVDDALSVLANKTMPVEERRETLKQIVAATFDFNAMSRSAMGYHWTKLTPEQQQEFAQVFTAFIQDSYLSKINDYQGQQVDFVRTTMDGDEYAQVNSKIVQQGKQPLPVNYRLKKTAAGWKIYDVTVDAISIIANYRNQFNRVMNNQGYATLISDLKSKQESIAQSIGSN
jgi:phospholipid transport system substrate-binding protein